jgi:hypothetical protein
MDAEESSTISAIKIIMYVITIVIIIITIITIINYILYTIYSIHAVVKELTYVDSPYFKQKDIYNYMLLSYIHLLKKEKYDVEYKYSKTYDFVSKLEETGGTDKNLKHTDTNITEYLSLSDVDKKSKFDTYKSSLEKWLIKKVINDKDYYVTNTVSKNYIIGDVVDDPKFNIPNNVIDELNILHDKDINYVIIPRGKPKNLDDTSSLYVGKYDMYEKKVGTKSIYGHFSKFISELFPLNLINLNDDKASYLYIHINNSFYEVVLLLIFVILLLIFISNIYTFYDTIIKTLLNKSDKSEISVIGELSGEYKYITFVIIAIFIYCLIHSIIYKYLFITNVYDRLYDMYNELIKPDLYVSSFANNQRKKIKFNYNVLDTLKEMSHNGTINIYNANQYTVVNFDKIEEVSIEKQLEEFTNVMIDINKNFTTSNANYNYYTNKLFTNIYKEVNTDSSDVITKNLAFTKAKTDSDAAPTDTGKKSTLDTATSALTLAKIPSIEYKSTILFILIIYIYFINNNKSDPYIIIKLNKLIFGTVANVDLAGIDKDIEYTLLLRSLVYEKLDIGNMDTYITNIKMSVINWSKEGSDLSTDDLKLLQENIDEKTKTFISLFATTNDNLNFWSPVYFLNLYLAVEIGVNLLLILFVLIIISNYANIPNIQIYIDKVRELIDVAIEELKTAIVGIF